MATAIVDGLRALDGVSAVRLDERDEATALASASENGATWLISGGYQHVAGQVRITARLLDVATGELLQTVKVDGALDALTELMAEAVSTLGAGLDARRADIARHRSPMAMATEERA